jgi:thiol:disulfide interchange protein DsbA
MLFRSIALLALLLTLLLATSLASAQALPEKYQAGKHYFAINPPQPTSSGNKVEVIEVFSYGCIHCASFQPMVDEWKKKMPAGAAFSYMPAFFQPTFALFGRGYYTAEVLGVAEKGHQDLFKALFVEQKPIHSLEDIARFYSAYGVKADDFVNTATSFAVETKVNRANQMVKNYNVDGTPTVVVAGKYRVTGASAEGYDKVFDVVNFLIAKELAQPKQ